VLSLLRAEDDRLRTGLTGRVDDRDNRLIEGPRPVELALEVQAPGADPDDREDCRDPERPVEPARPGRLATLRSPRPVARRVGGRRRASGAAALIAG